MRKKYKPNFSDNREQLENPSDQDILAMHKITLEELAENARDSRRIVNKKFHQVLDDYNEVSSKARSSQTTAKSNQTTPTEFVAEMIDESSFDMFDYS